MTEEYVEQVDGTVEGELVETLTPRQEQLQSMQRSLLEQGRRCHSINDHIIDVTVNAQDVYDAVMEVVTYFRNQGAWTVFPVDEGIRIVEDQQVPVLFRRMSDEEEVLLGQVTSDFITFLNTNASSPARKWNLNPIEIQGANGPIQYLPLVYDPQTMRQLIFTQLFQSFIQNDPKYKGKVLQLPGSN